MPGEAPIGVQRLRVPGLRAPSPSCGAVEHAPPQTGSKEGSCDPSVCRFLEQAFEKRERGSQANHEVTGYRDW